MVKKSKTSRRPCSSAAIDDHSLLLRLPDELLQLVLSHCRAEDLLTLLQVSKSMAQQVMQHSSGSLELQVQARQGKSWASTQRLLQWVPPSSLKLKLQCTSCCKQQQQQQQQMQQLGVEALDAMLSVMEQQLPCCCSCAFRCTSRDEDGSARCQPASAIRTLVLNNTIPPDVACLPSTSSMPLTRRKQKALNLLQRLRSSLTDRVSLHLQGYKHHPPLVLLTLWAPHIKELHITDMWVPWKQLQDHGITQLQQLQKLVLPHVAIRGTEGIRSLLKLASLTHVEVQHIDGIKEDLSNHPCAWQCLQLHGMFHDLESMAHMPLHSLLCPLQLGCGSSDDDVQIELPQYCGGDVATRGSVRALQQLAAQLLRCCVRVRANCLHWWQHGHFDSMHATDSTEQQNAAMLAAISPAFGPQKKVCLSEMSVGKGVVSALAATHHSTMTCLKLDGCALEVFVDGATLTRLPRLNTLELDGCYASDENKGWGEMVIDICQHILSAMAQQAAGRKLDVWFKPSDPEEQLQHVLAGISWPQDAVNITTLGAYDEQHNRLVVSYERM